METNHSEQQPKQKPDNMLIWAILSTALCCLPFGIVSIVYSSKVDTLWASGDFPGAEDAAKKAKMWALIGASIGLFVFIITFAIMLIGAMMG